jgi:protein O-GlcNAc transferase
MAPFGSEELRIEVDQAVREAAAQAGAGEVDRALATLAPLLNNDTSPVAARFVLAMTAWRLERLDWALELARACHESAPMDGTIAEVMASLHAQVGNVVDSIFAGKLSVALGSDSPLSEFVPAGFPSFKAAYQAIEERPLIARAKRHLGEGRIADAIEKARQHMALNTDDVVAREFYAGLLLRAGRASDAVDELRRSESDGCDGGPLAALYARSLASVGDYNAARHWHEKAASVRVADPAIAAARVADGVWLDSPSCVASSAQNWVRRFCAPPKPRARRPKADRLVIAYLATGFSDRRDAAAVAAVARSHDRDSVRVIGYGSGAQSWEENAALRGAFDAWQDVGMLDGATLARYVAQDAVNLLVDAAGFGSVQGLQALAGVTGAIRLSWLGNPGEILAPIYDARIVAEGIGGDLWRIGGGYPIPTPTTLPQKTDHAVPQFGADISLAQLDSDTLDAWCRILRALPSAKLLLRLDDAGRGNIDRLVSRFGTEFAARIDIVATERFEDFYARLEVGLAPWRGVSPRSAAESVACRVPMVAIEHAGATQPYGAFLRRVAPDASLVARSVDAYVARAVALAMTPTKLPEPNALHALSFAQAIENHATAALSGVSAS